MGILAKLSLGRIVDECHGGVGEEGGRDDQEGELNFQKNLPLGFFPTGRFITFILTN